MDRRVPSLARVLAALSAVVPVASSAEDQAGAVRLLKSDSRAPYVHRLTLYDHKGAAINPNDPAAPPYSPRATCSKCHPYATIAHGWHFNGPDAMVSPGRPGEPWLLVERDSGTVLPLSGRRWPGTYAPVDAGLTEWQFVRRFGRHLPGGGFGEPDEQEVRAAPKKLRWGISGRLEIDCMFCHSADQQYDPAEAAPQIEKENLKWAPTAALGLAVVRGAAKDVPDDWDPEMPENPNYPEPVGPQLVWDKSRFDADKRVFFHITRRPPPERCYFCHTARVVGADEPNETGAFEDVHLAAGLICVDCHRNDIDHKIVRGYDGEAAERGEPSLAAFSCEGCHLGVEGAEDPTVALGGRHRAPHPQHGGLPPWHLEKLTCTACHAGPWPAMDAQRFQTALAHGLGLATREREDTDPPEIVGPIFGRQPDGKIAPQRVVWPAFWGRLAGGEARPFAPELVGKVIRQVLGKGATNAKQPAALSDEQIDQVLEALASQAADSPAVFYVRDGHIYLRPRESGPKRWVYGGLAGSASSSEMARLADLLGPLEAAAAPYRWSFAHDVRPAAQALGARGCTDCHDDEGAIFFGRLTTAGDARAGELMVKSMLALRGDDAALIEAWEWGFVARLAFKWVGFGLAGVVLLVLLRYGFAGLAVVLPADGGAAAVTHTSVAARSGRGLTRVECAVHAVALAGFLVTGATGFGAKHLLGELAGWPLLVHMVGAPLFMVGLAGVALLWAPRCWFNGVDPRCADLNFGQKLLFWVALVLGLVTVLTMLAAMLPAFGYAAQETLEALHELSGLLLVIVMVAHTVVSWMARRARGKAT